jgi:septal ring factor EnvC (AmiA/AmiB activator)
MKTTKTGMIEGLIELIGPLDFSKIEKAQADYNSVRQRITEDEKEAEILEVEFNKLADTSMAERVGAAAATGEDLDKVQAAPEEMRSRLAKVHHRIEILKRELRRYESKIQLAREEILAQVEGAVDRMRASLSPELTSLLQGAERLQEDWSSALKETLAKNRMTVQSFQNRPRESFSVFPKLDASLLPFVLYTLPNALIKTRGLVEPPIIKE